jgi:hypothetical protein
MCDAVATGKEHVPPKCIFPEDRKYRKQLITVPSCDEHNSKKSDWDELLRGILTVIEGANKLANEILAGPVMRSIDHNPQLIDTLWPNLLPIQVCGSETGMFTLDSSRQTRFKRSIEMIVRGLFFHESGEKKKLTSDLGVLLARPGLQAMFDEAVGKLPASYMGANPRVFQYAFDTNGKISFCRLRFYEAHPILIRWEDSPESSLSLPKPQNLPPQQNLWVDSGSGSRPSV